MKTQVLSTLLMAGALFFHGSASAAPAKYKIMTASERGTYITIGRDLAKFVAPAADIELEALPSAGSAENIKMLRYEPGVKLALVQSDVYQSFLDAAGSGNSATRAIIKPLRVILPLYNEEIYFVVRADAEQNYIHEIKNAKINAGDLGSGTALTSETLYRLMFGEPMNKDRTSYLSNEEALVKLVTDKTLDVVAVVAGQPAKLLADMKPGSRSLIKLLKFDLSHASSKEVLKTYFAATVRARNYPNLLTEDLPGLAVKAFLVTYDFRFKGTEGDLRHMARSLCQNFPVLQEKGHPKWREVELALPDLGRGWFYYGPTTRELRACIAAEQKLQTRVTSSQANLCSQKERLLGVCK